MTTKITRREFLMLTGATGAAMHLASCQGKDVAAENRGFMDRVAGRPITDLPQIEDAWSYEDSTLTLDLAKLPELEDLGGAVRIEGEALPDPIFAMLGEDEAYYAFKNACTHFGRKIDHLAGKMTLECCSINRSTFDYAGSILSGPAKEPLTSYALTHDDEKLAIALN